MRGMNCMRRGNAAGESAIVGGMKTAAAGTATVTGTITITGGVHRRGNQNIFFTAVFNEWEGDANPTSLGDALRRMLCDCISIC